MMRRKSVCPPEPVEVRMEDVLAIEEAELLEKAGNGKLPCPWCGRPLRGEFVYFELEDEDSYAGVRLSCSCGFVEY
jgi:hypothetical protein